MLSATSGIGGNDVRSATEAVRGRVDRVCGLFPWFPSRQPGVADKNNDQTGSSGSACETVSRSQLKIHLPRVIEWNKYSECCSKSDYCGIEIVGPLLRNYILLQHCEQRRLPLSNYRSRSVLHLFPTSNANTAVHSTAKKQSNTPIIERFLRSRVARANSSRSRARIRLPRSSDRLPIVYRIKSCSRVKRKAKPVICRSFDRIIPAWWFT